MAKIGDAPRKRVGDYNPDVETGNLLDTIANKPVVIHSVSFDSRKGKKGPYTLAIMEISEDGEVDHAVLYHTGGEVVVERLAAVFGLTLETLENEFLARNVQPNGDGVLPVDATFTKIRSTSNPTQSYWTVS